MYKSEINCKERENEHSERCKNELVNLLCLPDNVDLKFRKRKCKGKECKYIYTNCNDFSDIFLRIEIHINIETPMKILEVKITYNESGNVEMFRGDLIQVKRELLQ